MSIVNILDTAILTTSREFVSEIVRYRGMQLDLRDSLREQDHLMILALSKSWVIRQVNLMWFANTRKRGYGLPLGMY